MRRTQQLTLAHGWLWTPISTAPTCTRKHAITIMTIMVTTMMSTATVTQLRSITFKTRLSRVLC